MAKFLVNFIETSEGDEELLFLEKNVSENQLKEDVTMAERYALAIANDIEDLDRRDFDEFFDEYVEEYLDGSGYEAAIAYLEKIGYKVEPYEPIELRW